MRATAYLKRRILVVDDEPMVCEAVKLMLHFDGHQVDTANDAAQALALIRQNGYDLVLTDYEMPCVKGDLLAKAIKRENPAPPVVMITAYAELLPKPVPGVDLVISKPFLLENLREAIGRVCPDPAA